MCLCIENILDSHFSAYLEILLDETSEEEESAVFVKSGTDYFFIDAMRSDLLK